MSVSTKEGQSFTLELDLWPFHLDCEGRYPLSRLVSRMIHVAGEHATFFGYGIHRLMEQNLTWVLSRMSINFVAEIDVTIPLAISTGIRSYSGLSTERVIVLSQGGHPVAYSLSRWVGIDMSTRRPVPITDILNDPSVLVDYSHLPIPEIPRLVLSAEMREELQPVYTHTVRYSDLDINRHVNSSVWVARAMDAIPLEQLSSRTLKSVQLHFVHEATVGCELLVEHYHDELNMQDAMRISQEGSDMFLLQLSWHEQAPHA